jgi:hypothetical protein
LIPEPNPNPIPCLWYNGRGSWSLTIAEWLATDMYHFRDYSRVPEVGCIIVAKADEFDVDELNHDMLRFPWVLLIVCSNEEGKFNPAALTHPNFRLWLQTPHKHQTANRYLPWGWTPACARPTPPSRCWEWVFAGQITHERRRQCAEVLQGMMNGRLIQTAGFSQGLAQSRYFDLMASAKLAPCPSGPITVDSFRVCEALELGTIPVVDWQSPTGPYPEYWTRVFGVGPLRFPIFGVEEWEQFPRLAGRLLAGWDRRAATTRTWWANWKHSLYRNFCADIEELTACALLTKK